jgi:hypothetical protein
MKAEDDTFVVCYNVEYNWPAIAFAVSVVATIVVLVISFA